VQKDTKFGFVKLNGFLFDSNRKHKIHAIISTLPFPIIATTIKGPLSE
jgi:hypothetical protein